MGARDGMRPSSGSNGVTGSETVRMWLLGGFRVSVGNRIVREEAWHLRKAASLVKLLALSPQHLLHREEAMDLLWPVLAPKAAANNLHYALHNARRTLRIVPNSASPYLRFQGEQLALCPGGQLWVDVEAFEDATRTARRIREPAPYRRAIELYAGELLPEDRYEEWAEVRRQELRSVFLSLLVELAGLYEERREYRAGIEALQRAVSEEPTNEGVHAGLMRLYALSGRQGEALSQYEHLQEVLSGHLSAKPDATTRALHKQIAAGRFPQTEPAGPALEDPLEAEKHNLPAARTNFVGREREMVEVKRTLAMTSLLTLTGTGGCGKTRLALELARYLVGTYPDGVWLVELAPLAEGDLIAQEVSATLGVREQPGCPLLDTLLASLGDKVMLLVLDNCEHLIDATTHLAEALLNSCPRVRVLATSRESLGVRSELSWLVPSLSAPTTQQSQTVEELEGYESARLFADRASMRHPSFDLTPENAQAVGQVCATLEGMPLAIELAAARVGLLSAEQISERLGHSLKLLTGGDRTADHRHQTLRLALDWSFDLLSEPEQALFRRLSVFAGGFILEAAESVGAGGSIEEEDVLDLLGGLVEKSLVVAEESWERGARYRLLEPIRQYAREKLEGSKEAEPALRLCGALGDFWHMRGYLSEGWRWLEAALEEGEGSATVRLKALLRAARIAWSWAIMRRQLYWARSASRSRGSWETRRLDQRCSTSWGYRR
jgi:predicted ATPase/DNA-binding SARP family transcriptional activator